VPTGLSPGRGGARSSSASPKGGFALHSPRREAGSAERWGGHNEGRLQIEGAPAWSRSGRLVGRRVLSACSSGSSTATGGIIGARPPRRDIPPATRRVHDDPVPVNAAKSGDWILVAPGDYKETPTSPARPASVDHGISGVLADPDSNLHIRGMNRNTTVVDGPSRGARSARRTRLTSSSRRAERPGHWRNGIVVYRPTHVSIGQPHGMQLPVGEPDRAMRSGIERWRRLRRPSACTATEGSYLTAETTYFGGESTAANTASSRRTQGRRRCLMVQHLRIELQRLGHVRRRLQQVCDVTISKAWMEYNALGYSGPNSAGRSIKASLFDTPGRPRHNTQINGDPPARRTATARATPSRPSPTPARAWVAWTTPSRTTTTRNAPEAGKRRRRPTGTRDDALRRPQGHGDAQHVQGQRCVADPLHPLSRLLDTGVHQSCTGTGGVEVTASAASYDPMNTAGRNHIRQQRVLQNPSDADYGQIALNPNQPLQLLHGANVARTARSERPRDEVPTCGSTVRRPTSPRDCWPKRCAIPASARVGGANYPVRTRWCCSRAESLPTMPNPCVNVPDNAWCSGGKPVS